MKPKKGSINSKTKQWISLIRADGNKKVDSLRDLWGNIKWDNNHIIRLLEGEEIEEMADIILEKKKT